MDDLIQEAIGLYSSGIIAGALLLTFAWLIGYSISKLFNLLKGV